MSAEVSRILEERARLRVVGLLVPVLVSVALHALVLGCFLWTANGPVPAPVPASAPQAAPSPAATQAMAAPESPRVPAGPALPEVPEASEEVPAAPPVHPVHGPARPADVQPRRRVAGRNRVGGKTLRSGLKPAGSQRRRKA